MVNGDELRAVGKRALDLNLGHHLGHALHHRLGPENRRAEAHDFGDRLAVANQLENLRRDERDRFGMIELQAAGAALARELARRKDEQLVDFAWRKVHNGSPKPGIIPYWLTATGSASTIGATIAA